MFSKGPQAAAARYRRSAILTRGQLGAARARNRTEALLVSLDRSGCPGDDYGWICRALAPAGAVAAGDALRDSRSSRQHAAAGNACNIAGWAHYRIHSKRSG